MDVIRHEAVRNKRKARLAGSSQKLLVHQIDERLCDEDLLSRYRAETKGVTIQTAVAEITQMFGMSRGHVERLSNRRATVRPAEAGPHVLTTQSTSAEL
jgi:hypothetical protein